MLSTIFKCKDVQQTYNKCLYIVVHSDIIV